jgi:hypothetical protein
MSTCPPDSDLRELGHSMIKEFEERVAAIPEYLRAPFHEEARQLETQLLTVYKLIAMCVRKEQDLDRVAKSWALMVELCDEFAKRLHQLADQHPGCGAEAYYDKVLDLRSKCQRLQQMHS